MPIDKQLLDIIACPVDKADLKYSKRGKTEKLTCTKCKTVYQVKDGIPILLPPDSKL